MVYINIHVKEQYSALGKIRNYADNATSDRGLRVLFSVTEEQSDYCLLQRIAS